MTSTRFQVEKKTKKNCDWSRKVGLRRKTNVKLSLGKAHLLVFIGSTLLAMTFIPSLPFFVKSWGSSWPKENISSRALLRTEQNIKATSDV